MIRKWLCVILCLCLSCGAVVAAAEDDGTAPETTVATQTEPTEEPENLSRPRLIVEGYEISPETVKPNRNSHVKATVKNTHRTLDAQNIKLTVASADGAILSAATDSVFLEKLEHGKSYTWEFDVLAAASAESGGHMVTIAADYETQSGESCSSSDNITLTVDNPPTTEPQPTPQSQPRLMVTEYTVDGEGITPDGNTTVKITLTNTNKNRSVRNIKLTLQDESGEIVSDGMGTGWLDRIAAGGSYTWEVSLSAVHTAAVGEHRLTVTSEYEDADGGTYSSSDILRVPVRQTVRLDYDGAVLPVKMVQGDTSTISVNLMNTGKSTLYNCRFEITGEHFTVGGATFVGEIAPGESKSGSANIRIDDYLGEASGQIVISYEDDFGKVYEQKVDVSTISEERVELTEEPEEKEKKNGLWWLFLLLGMLVGGGAGFGIPFAIRSAKARREDEQRL